MTIEPGLFDLLPVYPNPIALIDNDGTIGLTSGTLDLGPANVIASGFDQSGGVLTGTGTLTVTGASSFTSYYDAETGSGTTLLEGATSVDGYIALDGGRTLENAGSLAWTGGDIDLGTNPYGTTVGGGTIDNVVGGVFDIQNSGLTVRNYSGTNIFQNAGALKKSAGTGESDVNVAVDNTGTIEVDAGTLSLNNGGTLEAGSVYMLAAGAALRFDGGTVLFKGGAFTGTGTLEVSGGTVDATAASASLTGNQLALDGGVLELDGATTVAGLSQSHSTLSGAGKLTVTGSASLNSNSYSAETGSGTTDLEGAAKVSGYVALDGGRTLENAGSLAWTGGDIDLGTNPYGTTVGGGTIDNVVGGVFDIQNSGLTVRNYSGTNIFQNAGALKKSAGTGESDVNVAVDNTGTIEVDAGTLSLNNGGTLEAGSFTSNSAGRITSGTDSDGRTVTYTYDASNTQLLSATDASGTTSYSYVTPTGSVTDNALSSITYSDGTDEYFTYDAEGRLASQSGDNGVGKESYDYSKPGQVIVTDALGNKTNLLYGADGSLAQVQDANGNVTQLRSDTNGNLTGATTPGGNQYGYTYGSSGNLTGYTDPLGGSVSTTYAPGTDNLASFTNQLGAKTSYTYDAAGNVTGITYQDGSGDSYQYNTSGLLTNSTDADGNTTQFSYDSNGNLTAEKFADGTSDLYSYNSQGNLTSATDQTGAKTRYTYDAADRLTSITDSQGQVESYAYNSLGELATRTEPDGSKAQYSYDSYGRLTELQDGSGNLLDKYTYNAAGELTRTDTGNGASTSYNYDNLGNVTEILNTNADGTTASRYDYTYNTDGQVIQDATSDGVWKYTYDASGQLTHAVFVSTDASIQNQDLSYSYDAAGNRVSTTANGVTTQYTTNDLNQYTQVGGTAYTYDADGRVTSETNSAGKTSFTYNYQGQLTSEITPTDTYSYSYDALGNLVSSTKNGTTTSYVNDPLSLSAGGTPLTSVAQAYGPNNTLLDSYDYGLGLASEISASNQTSYYDTDLNDNIIGLSGSNGNQTDSYFYDPFGNNIQLSGDDINSFQYSGGFGVVDSNSIDLMRDRGYDSSLGRFLSEDPASLAGGTDLYEYVGNNPIGNVDPSGQTLYRITKGASGAVGALSTLGAAAELAAPTVTTFIAVDVEAEAVIALVVVADAPLIAVVAAGGLAAYGLYKGYEGIKDLGEGISDIAENGFSSGSGDDLFESLLNFGGLGFKFNDKIAEGLGEKLFDKFPELKEIADKFGAEALDKFESLLSGKLKLGDALTEIIANIYKKVASLFRDPHLSTFDGLHYDFQTAGEFVLSKSTVSGDNFQVQARISEPSPNGAYSIITELGIQVGFDRVTIDSTRAGAPVWVNGKAAVFVNGIDQLAGGAIIQNGNRYQVLANTGEEVDSNIDSFGVQNGPVTSSEGIDTTVSLPQQQVGGVNGLLGDNNGVASKDLTLADGTVITDFSRSEIYGAFADAWRVMDATSLLDYGTGQTTATFTDKTYPGHVISLNSFPTAAVNTAETLAAEAGITDPGLIQDAAYDYLVTGSSSYFTVEANAQQQGVVTTAEVDTPVSTTAPMLGIMALGTSQVEAASGPTAITFQLYRSGDTSGAVMVSYAVVAPNSGYVDASSFGGTLPSGTVSFAAGQTSATVPITLTSGIGDVASKTLAVQITAPSPNIVIGSTAQETITNPSPIAGPPPVFSVELVKGAAVAPVVGGNTWTFDLGTVSGTTAFDLAVFNAAATGADDLGGTITASSSGGISATVIPSFSDVSPSMLLDVAALAVDGSKGSGTETLTFTPSDGNSTGYSAALPAETVVIKYNTVHNYAQAAFEEVSGGGTFSQSGTAYALNLGTIALGANPVAVNLGVENNAVGPADVLSGSFDVTGASAFTNSGLDAFTGVAAGSADMGPTVTLSTTTAGAFSETITLHPTGSNGSGYSGALPDETLTITGVVQAPVVTTVPSTLVAHEGEAQAVSGTRIVDDNPDATVTATLSDNTGLLSVTGDQGTVTGSGSTSLALTGSLGQVNADLASLSYSSSTAGSDTITVASSDSTGAADSHQITVSVGQVVTLSPGSGSFSGGSSGNNEIVVGGNVLGTGNSIDGGTGGNNLLSLVGAGIYDLRKPQVLTNIQSIDVQEGRASYVGGGHLYASQAKTIYLRDGLDLEVNVTAATLDPGNPNPAGITIIGAKNADVITLGAGNDAVTVGGPEETVKGGPGTDLIFVTAETIGATIDGGTGDSTLYVSGGGTIAMGDTITDITQVKLSGSSTPYNFTANGVTGMVIDDTSSGHDVIAAGGAGQMLTGGAPGKETMIGAGAGTTTFQDTAAAFSADTLKNFLSSDIIDFSDMTFGQNQTTVGFAANDGDTGGMLTLYQNGIAKASVDLFGQMLAGFTPQSDGHGGTMIVIDPHQQAIHLATAHG